MEVKDKLMVNRRAGGGENGGNRGRVQSRNMYKGLTDMDYRVRTDCGSRGVRRARESNWGKMGTTVIERKNNIYCCSPETRRKKDMQYMLRAI